MSDRQKQEATASQSPVSKQLDKIRARWSTAYDRGAHDYTDAGCRVLAEHAFRDIPLLVAVAEAAEEALWAQCPACLIERTDYRGPDGDWLPSCPNCGSTADPEVVPERLVAALASLREAARE